MQNQPAGWSYWICDCDNVHFHRAKIFAAVDMPNNDGIHINCCRNVTVSDCNISCGDDCIVVRAYSAPLHENKVCEKVAVTNCNLTSHACAVRLGWINDGVIRNCTFSNLNVTVSCSGLTAYLPGNPAHARMSDEGFEATLIENISFSNIHAFSARMPCVKGRPDCHVQNIYFSDCHFKQVRYEDIPTKFAQRMAKFGVSQNPVTFRYVDNLVMNNTTFTAE